MGVKNTLQENTFYSKRTHSILYTYRCLDGGVYCRWNLWRGVVLGAFAQVQHVGSGVQSLGFRTPCPTCAWCPTGHQWGTVLSNQWCILYSVQYTIQCIVFSGVQYIVYSVVQCIVQYIICGSMRYKEESGPRMQHIYPTIYLYTSENVAYTPYYIPIFPYTYTPPCTYINKKRVDRECSIHTLPYTYISICLYTSMYIHQQKKSGQRMWYSVNSIQQYIVHVLMPFSKQHTVVYSSCTHAQRDKSGRSDAGSQILLYAIC